MPERARNETVDLDRVFLPLLLTTLLASDATFFVLLGATPYLLLLDVPLAAVLARFWMAPRRSQRT